MNITVTDLQHCKKQLRLEIPAETVRAETDKIAAKLARQIDLPGFRRGHVPPSVVKTRFRKELRDEMVSHLLPEALQEAITQKEIKVVGEPKLDEMKFGEDDSIDLTITVEVVPEFELGNYEGITLRKRVYRVRDEDVEKTIDRLREGLAELKPVEDRGAQEGDIVTANITGVPSAKAVSQSEEAEVAEEANAEGSQAAAQLPEEIKQQDVKIEIGGRGVLKEFSEGLAGAKAGDVRSFTVEYPEEYRPEQFAGRTVDYSAEVVAVHVKELPAADDEFARSVEEDLNSIEDLRAKVRSNLEHEFGHRTDDELKEAAIEQLIDRNRFEVPEQVVEKQIDSRLGSFIREMASQGLDPRTLKIDWDQIRESQRERAEREVRLTFILNRIAENENIEASEDEVNNEIGKIAEGTRQSPASLKARLTKEGALDSIREQVRSRKALDLVVTTAEVITEEVEGRGEETAATGDEDGQAEG